jgi:hypothetical protein
VLQVFGFLRCAAVVVLAETGVAGCGLLGRRTFS